MDKTTLSLIALGIMVLGGIAFFAVFRGSGEWSLKSIFGKFTVKGKNPTAIPAGVKTGDIDAGRDATVQSSSESGGVETGKVKTKGDVKITHTPGQPPPKA